MVMKLFTKHPKSIGESYWEHFKTATVFSGWLILAGIVCAVHAILPFLFTKTASKIVKKLYIKY